MRQKNHDKVMNLRIPTALHEILLQMATLNEVSLSGLVRDILQMRATEHRINEDSE